MAHNTNACRRLLCLFLTLAMALALTAAARAATATPYRDWKQYDGQWGDQVLYSRTTREVGCLATSVAMLAVQAGLKSESCFDPGVFVAELRRIGGFTADNDLIWEKVPLVLPGFVTETPWAQLKGTQGEKADRLASWLEQGYSVAVAVKNEAHWVALRGVSGGAVTMMDPGSAATSLFGKYPAAGVTRAALFRAEKPPAAHGSAEASPEQPAQPPAPPTSGKLDLLGLLGDWCNQDMAESLFAFFGTVAELLWKCVEWVTVNAKLW